MARGVNKVILIGNLGADPETRYTANQTAVTNLRMATTRSWRDRQSNELREETEWHRVVLFGRQAEVAHEYLKKGSQCYIEGRLQTRKWQDKEGQDRWTTEVVADDLQLLGGRESTGTMPQRGEYQQSGSRKPSGDSAGGMPVMDDFEDDIPF